VGNNQSMPIITATAGITAGIIAGNNTN